MPEFTLLLHYLNIKTAFASRLAYDPHLFHKLTKQELSQHIRALSNPCSEDLKS